MMIRLKHIFLKIWTSSIGSGVISAIIFAGLSALSQQIFRSCDFFKVFFEIRLPIGIFISVVLALMAVIMVFAFRIKKEKKRFAKQESEFKNIRNKQKEEMENLQKRISILEKLPENPRLKVFQQGDVVIRNLDKEKITPEKYSVIGIDPEKQEVIVRNKKGEEASFLPNELLTEAEADKNFGDMLNQFYVSRNINRW